MASQLYRTTPAPAVATTRRRSGAGFTLVELLVTVTIVSILLAIGVPNLTDFIRTTRVRSATFDLLSDLNFARSEAIKGGSTVAIQAASGGFVNGWNIVRSSDNAVLRSHSPLSGVTISSNANVVFRANGRANPFGSYCVLIGSVLKRKISVSMLGQVTLDEEPTVGCS